MYRVLLHAATAVRVLTAAVLLSMGTALGQGSQPASGHIELPDPFAGWHTALSNAADKELAAVLADRSWMKAPDRSVRVTDPKAQAPTNGLEGLRAGIERMQHLRPVIEPILRQEGVPPELSAVVLVESGGQAMAVSPKGARGVWQFMPDTARRYGLMVNPRVDERVDVLKSTRAAARYLRDLHNRFASWPLAIAAYNAGEDVVQRAIDRTGTVNFAELQRSLSPETRVYVPAVTAAAQTFSTQWVVPIRSTPGRKSGRVVYAFIGGN